MAKGIIFAKLFHQRALLMRHHKAKGHAEIFTAAPRTADQIEKIPKITKISCLRGLEGAGAAAHYKGFKLLFTEE